MKTLLKVFSIFTLLGLSAGCMFGQVAAPTVTQVVTVPLISVASFTLSSSPNPSLTTQSVTYNGVVAAPSGDATPTGTVTVCDGGTGTTCSGGISVATVTLSPTGTFTCTETNMSAGTHTISAHYSGDKIYASSL